MVWASLRQTRLGEITSSRPGLTCNRCIIQSNKTHQTFQASRTTINPYKHFASSRNGRKKKTT